MHDPATMLLRVFVLVMKPPLCGNGVVGISAVDQLRGFVAPCSPGFDVAADAILLLLQHGEKIEIHCLIQCQILKLFPNLVRVLVPVQIIVYHNTRTWQWPTGYLRKKIVEDQDLVAWFEQESGRNLWRSNRRKIHQFNLAVANNGNSRRS